MVDSLEVSYLTCYLVLFIDGFAEDLLVLRRALLEILIVCLQDLVLLLQSRILRSKFVHELLYASQKISKLLGRESMVDRIGTYSYVFDELVRFAKLAKVFRLNVAQNLHAVAPSQSGVERSRREAARSEASLTLFATWQLLWIAIVLFVLQPLLLFF